MEEDTEEVVSRVTKLSDIQLQIEDNAKKFKEGINKNYTFLDEQLAKLRNQKKELKELKDLVKYLPKDQRDNQEALIAAVNKSIHRIEDSLAPRTGSMFVRLLLGKVNVKQYRDGERFILKQEYQKFKRKTDPLFLLFVALQLYERSRSIEILFQVWLLYYYVTLALRENILRVNGSNIKLWWIIHHYLSIAVSLTLVTWNNSGELYQRFLPQFLYFSFLQGIVQILQTQYQQAKLYKAIAMGKADLMDVPGEFSGSSWWFESGLTSNVIFLLPFLLFVQSFQLYNSYTLLSLAYSTFDTVDWQVVVCGVLFFALGVGNLSTTLYTYKEKLLDSHPHSQ